MIELAIYVYVLCSFGTAEISIFQFHLKRQHACPLHQCTAVEGMGMRDGPHSAVGCLSRKHPLIELY